MLNIEPPRPFTVMQLIAWNYPTVLPEECQDQRYREIELPVSRVLTLNRGYE